MHALTMKVPDAKLGQQAKNATSAATFEDYFKTISSRIQMNAMIEEGMVKKSTQNFDHDRPQPSQLCHKDSYIRAVTRRSQRAKERTLSRLKEANNDKNSRS